jgi:hypothetical protein
VLSFNDRQRADASGISLKEDRVFGEEMTSFAIAFPSTVFA